MAAKVIPDEVYSLFEQLTLNIIKQGFERYSARAVLHQIRWHKHVDKGQREFKCNDHWTPELARWFMEKYPEHRGFFETREKQAA